MVGIRIQLVGLINITTILVNKVRARRDGFVGGDLSTTRKDNVDGPFGPRRFLKVLSFEIILGR